MAQFKPGDQVRWPREHVSGTVIKTTPARVFDNPTAYVLLFGDTYTTPILFSELILTTAPKETYGEV